MICSLGTFKLNRFDNLSKLLFIYGKLRFVLSWVTCDVFRSLFNHFCRWGESGYFHSIFQYLWVVCISALIYLSLFLSFTFFLSKSSTDTISLKNRVDCFTCFKQLLSLVLNLFENTQSFLWNYYSSTFLEYFVDFMQH